MMIEVKNMSFSYGKRKQKVFDDFSLALVNLLCSI